MEENGGIMRLPEGCIAHAMSLTTPRDCSRLAAVSTTFRSAAESDTVWESFLPSDHEEILARSVAPVNVSAKKDLYFRLCDPVIIDGGKMSFSLDRSTGRKCYTLSARELKIVWGDTPYYWKWRPHEDSRFQEVAELRDVWWLEIRGRVNCKVLSQRTNYAAYIIYKFAEHNVNFDFPNQEAAVRVGNHVCESKVCLKPVSLGRRQVMYDRYWSGRREFESRLNREETSEVGRAPQMRDDGWLEMELGEFFNDEGDDGEVDISFMEVKGVQRCGLIVEGIEVRPK